LARSVARAGRSKAWIDGRMATVGALAEAAGGLIELHGQHQHQALVHVEAQRRALDGFAGIDLSGLHRAPEPPAQPARPTSWPPWAAMPAPGPEKSTSSATRSTRSTRRGSRTSTRTGASRPKRTGWPAASAHRQAAAAALAAVSGPDDASALDRLAEAAQSLSGRAPLEPRSRSGCGRSWPRSPTWPPNCAPVVETWDDDPATPGGGARPPAAAPPVPAQVRGHPRRGPGVRRGGPGPPGLHRGRGAAGHRPRRDDRCRPPRWRRPRPRWPGPPGGRPGTGRPDRVHPVGPWPCPRPALPSPSTGPGRPTR
jgi:hypothetical protein